MSRSAAKAPKPTRWREATSLLVGERQRYHARRGGLNLEVSLRSTGHVDAVVSHVVQPEGRHETLVDIRWPVRILDKRLVAAQIAVAQRWCEQRADEIAKMAREVGGKLADRIAAQATAVRP